MAVVVVTFDGTRLNSSDSNTGWGNYGSGGGTPASEAANAYQITTGAAANTGAVGKKVNSTVGRVGVDYNGTAVDYTATANRLWFAKGYVADAFDLNTTFGAELAIGSADQSNYHEYNVAGSGSALSVYNTYPPQGGYLILCIDPTIDTWANTADSGGATDQTALTWYGFRCTFQNGNAKSENVALDAIDYGTGLSLLSGDTGTQGKYTDFYVFDQDDTNNRWGAAVGGGNAVVCRGIMSIGGSTTATEFNDATSVVTFPNGYHSRGLFGVTVNLDNASNVINDGSLIIGEGSRNGVDANDTRPDYTVVGTTQTSADFSHVLRNFRDVEYTSVCEVDGAEIECMLLTQGTAHIQNSVIKTNALTSIACLQDPTFGTTTDLHDVDFIQTGAGHAIEITTAGSYDFNNLTFTGYGADTTDSAAIDVTETTGTVTINIIGGGTPTYKTAGATVVLVVNPVTITITVQDTSGTPIENARALVKAGDTGDFPSDVTVTITRVSTTATVTHTSHGLSNGDEVVITKAVENEYNGIQTISNVTTNTYDYTVSGTPATPATGTIKSTFAFINALTNVSGVVTDTRTYANNQSLTGRVRKSSGSPYYKTGQVVGTVNKDTGVDITLIMLSDE